MCHYAQLTLQEVFQKGNLQNDSDDQFLKKNIEKEVKVVII